MVPHRADSPVHVPRCRLGASRWIDLLLGCVLLAAPAPARAVEPDALALQQLLASQSAARKALRTALTLASSEAIAEITALEATLAASGDGTAAGNALFTLLQELQVQMDAALPAAGNAQANAAKDALATLGSDLGSLYPRGFYPGDATPTALFEADFAKEVSKAYAKLHKRLKKTAARFQTAGSGLTFRLSPPRPFPVRNWNEEVVDFQLFLPAHIDRSASADGERSAASRMAALRAPLPERTILRWPTTATAACGRSARTASPGSLSTTRPSTSSTRP